jgi:hypothetical protein
VQIVCLFRCLTHILRRFSSALFSSSDAFRPALLIFRLCFVSAPLLHECASVSMYTRKRRDSTHARSVDCIIICMAPQRRSGLTTSRSLSRFERATMQFTAAAGTSSISHMRDVQRNKRRRKQRSDAPNEVRFPGKGSQMGLTSLQTKIKYLQNYKRRRFASTSLDFSSFKYYDCFTYGPAVDGVTSIAHLYYSSVY